MKGRKGEGGGTVERKGEGVMATCPGLCYLWV